MAADIHQVSEFNAGWASSFARPASQAAIKVQASFLGDRLAFEHLLDEINPTTRAVEFIAQ
jgi:hypothetical protein